MNITQQISKFTCAAILAFGFNFASAASPDQLSFSVLITAQSGGSLEGMVVDGGSWLTGRKLVHTAVLIRHPKGDLLWDSGIGTDVAQQMQDFAFWEKQLFKIENVKPAISQLKQHNYPVQSLSAIIPSHMHWDHASGLEDFIDTPIWVQTQEHEAARHGEPPAFIQTQFDNPALNWHYIELQDKQFKGFERSLDIYGDGSIVLVDLSGHTQGQLGLFLNTPDKGHYFFIGDTTWTLEGITQNKGRPAIVNWLVGVDDDVHQNDEVVEKIHQLSLSQPELIIIPAHDENVAAQLPNYPDFL